MSCLPTLLLHYLDRVGFYRVFFKNGAKRVLQSTRNNLLNFAQLNKHNCKFRSSETNLYIPFYILLCISNEEFPYKLERLLKDEIKRKCTT